MSADLCLPRIVLSSFFRRLVSELAERNSNTIVYMVGSQCSLKTHVRNLGYPLPTTNCGSKNHLFGRLPNSMATLTAYIFGMEHDIDNRSCALTTTGGLLHRPKMSWTLVHKRLQTRPAFYPPSVNSAFHFIVMLRRRRSANGTQPSFAKRWTVGCANNVP